MERFILGGKIWYVGNSIYVETEKYFGEQKIEEILLSDYIQEKVKEDSKVVITIDII